MNDFFEHKASGASLYHAPLLPEVENWKDLFEDQREWAFNGTNFPTMKGPHTIQQFGSYCNRRDGKSLTVKARQEILAALEKRMIYISNDRNYFEIVDHESGWSLICCKYGQIIGSVWLAYVRTDSIPKV